MMFGRGDDGTAYEVLGPEDGPPLILIHGLGASRRIWDQHLPAFADYRVINYDLYGHGESTAAPARVTLALFADQIARLLRSLEIERAHLIGFSIGGMINRRFAMDHPDKTASLVVLNSPHERGEAAQQLVEERALSVRNQGAFSTFDAALKRWFTPDYRENGPGPAKLRAWREQVDPESYAQSAWVLANGVRELIDPRPPIAVPSLIMTCENDSGSTPAMSQAIAKEIQGAELIVVPRLQHLGLMEDPAAFTGPILAFLKRIT